jgi:hypothetical protein
MSSKRLFTGRGKVQKEVRDKALHGSVPEFHAPLTVSGSRGCGLSTNKRVARLFAPLRYSLLIAPKISPRRFTCALTYLGYSLNECYAHECIFTLPYGCPRSWNSEAYSL